MTVERSDTPVARRAGGVPWKLVVAAGVVVSVVALSRVYDLPQRLTDAMQWIASKGAVGGAVFVALYVAATVLALPGLILSLGAGATYGLASGFVLVSAGSTLGATAAFLIARYVAREWIAERIARNPKFRALDDGVAEEGWKIVLLTRLSPVFPFNLQNFGYGLTRVPMMHYVAASWVGMIPGTLMYVYLGHAAGSLAAAGAGTEGRSPAQWALLAFGLMATVLVTVLITKIARRKLAEVQERAAHE